MIQIYEKRQVGMLMMVEEMEVSGRRPVGRQENMEKSSATRP